MKHLRELTAGWSGGRIVYNFRTMKRKLLFGVVAAAALVHGDMAAHHSLTGIYDSNKEVTVKGAVVRFEFINPHPFLTMENTDSRGAAQRWILEFDNRNELEGAGIGATTFQRGDQVLVSGYPSRTHPASLYVRRLERPADGFLYEHPD
jgi:hypothetical protein